MTIPKEVKSVVEKLKRNDCEAYIVGGCVRDLLRGVKPLDWDITTNAKPEEITKLFPNSFLENKFGTVTVLTDSEDETLKEIEITPYRVEAQYTDKRHPDEIRWAKTIEEDLARRDFTVNAMALAINPQPSTLNQYEIIDPFNGQKDLKDKIIRAVGEPQERFSEDALRLMRAVRFATTLGFKIEKQTAQAIGENAALLGAISQERIRDELVKIILNKKADRGIELVRELNLLKFIIPELEENYGVTQNKHHIYDCWEHALRSLGYAVEKDYNLEVRLAALFHDIGKPRTKQGEGPGATFYNHEVAGAEMTSRILSRLRFPKKQAAKITKLVRYHLFYYNPEEVGESSVRRLVRKVGSENVTELLQVRYCDRIGSGVAKAEPYKLRHLRYLIEKVAQDPISTKMLRVSGNEVMEILSLASGPKVGRILDILLGEVLEEPQKNREDYLERRIKKLGRLKEEELVDLAGKTRAEREKIETKRDEMTKKKYWVT